MIEKNLINILKLYYNIGRYVMVRIFTKHPLPRECVNVDIFWFVCFDKSIQTINNTHFNLKNKNNNTRLSII